MHARDVIRGAVWAGCFGATLAGCGINRAEHQRLLEEAMLRQQARQEVEVDTLRSHHSAELALKKAEIEGRDSLIAGLENELRTLGGNLKAIRGRMDKETEAQAAAIEAAREELRASQREVTAQAAAAQAAREQLEASQRDILELEQVRAVAELRRQQQVALREHLSHAVESGALEMITRDDCIVLRLRGKALFASGSTRLRKRGRSVLSGVAEGLLASTGRREILIGAHARPRARRNKRYPTPWELSAARASRATRFMVSKGIPPTRLVAAGYGPHRPTSPENAAARLEIVVLPWSSGARPETAEVGP